ncbi:MAG: hypothetical protein SO022_00695 [Selenomonadaceae bacterium]|nr:hypothetical protein [Selenomonadaceae bacterium]
MKVLFCNIAWMRWYKGVIPNVDVPVNGGSFVNENQDGSECDNFWKVPIVADCVVDDTNVVVPKGNMDYGPKSVIPKGDICFGFVETGHTNNNSRQLRLENIHDCSAYKKEATVEDVLVVFCATREGDRYPKVVGWYNHATVYRRHFECLLDNGDVLWKNMFCKAEDAVLLPVSSRRWQVPRAAIDKYGFGRSNVWYADYNQHEKVKPWVDSIIDKITNYDGENMRDVMPDEI